MCLALIIVCGGVTVSSDSQARPKASKKASKKSRSKTSKRKKIKSKRKKKKSVKRSKRKKKRVSLRKQPALSLSRLQKALQRSSSNQALSQAKVSYLFIDESGKVIASNHSEVLLHPASNIKIATTAAAYEILGADYQYHTQFYIHKDFVPIQNQSKKETATTKEQIPSTQLPILYWKASGDSKLTAKSLKKIAQQIKRYKIKKYQQLIIDDSDFTTDLAPGFADKPDDDAAYRAATGGIGYQFNAFITKVKPGKLKQKPIVEFVPNIPYLQLRNIATTSKKGKEALKIKLLAEQDNLIVELSGHIPIKHKGIQVRKRIADPFIFTAQTFLQCLKKEGISVVKGMRRGGLPLKESRVMIATHKSTTMKSLLSDVNFYSNNYMAEQTLLTLGLYQKKYGGWQEGLEVVRNFLTQKVGLTGYTYLNGSGLFGQARFSTQMMVNILQYMNRQTKQKFKQLLPMMGRQGTVKRRLRSLPKKAIYAKTGTLDDVSSISGYLTTRAGKNVIFSIIMNQFTCTVSQARSIQNEMLSYVWLLKEKSPTKKTKK